MTGRDPEVKLKKGVQSLIDFKLKRVGKRDELKLSEFV